MESEEYTFSDYLLWLQNAIREIEAIENQPVAQQEIRHKCGSVVREAGTLATQLGLTALYKKSLKVARIEINSEKGTTAYLCVPSVSRIFLSDCVKECRAARQESQIGTTDSAKPTVFKERNTVYEIAFDWFIRADACLPGWVTDRRAYDWARPKAAIDGEKLPPYETWARYLRIERSRRGEQKNRYPKNCHKAKVFVPKSA